MNLQRTLMVCLALAALVVLGIVFVFLPDGWNLLPLSLIALVIVALPARLKALRPSQGGEGALTQAATTEATEKDDAAVASDPDLARRTNRVFGPIAAGMIIDCVDFATFGPVGLVLGLPIGGLAGYWMGKALGLSRRASVGCAVAAGVYCTIPGTEFIPLATIVGACARFQESSKQRRPGKSA
jgi:hypothetical protein